MLTDRATLARRLAVTAGVAPALCLAAAAPASAAASLSIGDTSQLLARGAAISVPVDASCDAGDFGSLFLTVRQVRRGSLINQGDGGIPITCDGTTHTYTVSVSGSNAFRTGSAAVFTSLVECTPPEGNCTNAFDSAEIKVVR